MQRLLPDNSRRLIVSLALAAWTEAAADPGQRNKAAELLEIIQAFSGVDVRITIDRPPPWYPTPISV